MKKGIKEMKLREHRDRIEKFEGYLEKIRKIEKDEYEEHLKRDRVVKRRKGEVKGELSNEELEKEFLLDDYNSDNEEYDTNTGVSKEVQNLLDALSGPKAEDVMAEELEEFNKVKIFFTSRTHSQLSQFVSQLRLPEFPSSIDNGGAESTKITPLGSRKQLCINPQVNKYRDVSRINDSCMDLQKNSGKGCQFLKREQKNEDRVLINQFRGRTLAKIRDIEDLAELGKDLKICPYYASRNAMANSEIVTLPYQLLLQKSSREALGIDVRDSIVVIDEAHNLLDTISSLNSMTISISEVQMAHKGLKIYWKKFSKRLNSSNRTYLSQSIKIVGALASFMSECEAKPANEITAGKEVNPASIFKSSTADLINTYKLEKYLKQSKLAFKVDGYLEKLQNDMEKDAATTRTTPLKRLPKLLLSKVINFLQLITNVSSEGKIFYSKHGITKEFQLQYLLLDPSEQFKDIVDSARCVILAGGTMEPTNDYLTYLFPFIDRSKIELFSCGHVIPKKNLFISTIASYNNNELTFSFANRSSMSMIDNLGKILVDLARTIPHGMVIFFPSYQYLQTLIDRWKSTSTFEQINRIKKVFQEPTESTAVESMLSEYSQTIDNSSGAILFSVVGGKMSEGINFSDNLARAVVMIGLPFPNAFSAELIAKREYIEKTALSSGSTLQQARELSREYYENICMRAVNQCIGRAIRHSNDYAAMVLIDSRYNTGRIQSKLPNWIRTQIPETPLSYPLLHSALSSFFSSHSG